VQLSPESKAYLGRAEVVLPQSSIAQLATYDVSQNVVLAAHLQRGTPVDQVRASKLDRCHSSHLLFESLFKLRLLLLPYACHSVSCLRCAVEKSAAYMQRALTTIDRIPPDSLDLRHIVFTVRNVPLGGLAEAIPNFLKAWRQLRRYPAWKEHVRGYLWNFEVTYNRKDASWHPHVHVLADGSYFHHSTISASWASFVARRNLYADPRHCVHISRVDVARGRDLHSAIHEATKYVLKPFNPRTPPTAMLELVDALRGPPNGDYIHPHKPPRYRLRGTAGTLRLRRPADVPAQYAMICSVGRLLTDRESPLWTDAAFAKEFMSALNRHSEQMPYLIRAYPMIADLIAADNPDHRR